MRLLILPTIVCLVASSTTATSDLGSAPAVAHVEYPKVQRNAEVVPTSRPIVTALPAVTTNVEPVSASLVPAVAVPQVATLVPEADAPQLKPSFVEPNLVKLSLAADEMPNDADDTRSLSIGEVCDALAAAAQAHDLPVTFLVRLIWQESRFNSSAVSPVGAQGVAQFMPKTAAAYGLSDPFDPTQALATSARYLDELRRQFGNLGLAAAAYNAGPGRLREWLQKRASLPKETRNYVQKITGRSADNWVAEDSANLESALPQRAPCGHLSLDQDDLGVAAPSERQIVTEAVPPVLQRARAALQEPPPKPPEAEVRTASAEPARPRKRFRNLLAQRELSAARSKSAGKLRPGKRLLGKTVSPEKTLAGKTSSVKRIRIAMATRGK